MKHPSETDLALFSGGDAGLAPRLRLHWHLKRCRRCQAQVAAFRAQQKTLAALGGELPAGIHWDRLADEMKANIRVGLAAGECVAPRKKTHWRLSWRPAAVLASLVLLVFSGWWFRSREMRGPADVAGGIVLEATADGIEAKQADRALTLIHQSSEPVMLSVNASGVMTARYIDDDTGMVTINNVYAQ